MRTALSSGEIGAKVVTILVTALEDSSMSQRGLARASGVKLTRLGDVLRRGAAITVHELDDISRALGLVGWQVLREAETSVSGTRRHLAPVPDLPPTEVYGTPPAYDPELMAAQGEGTDIDAEQEGSQDLP